MDSITPFYTAIAALIFVGLSVRTLLLRRQLGVGVGTGGDERLARAVGVHANFAEYTPIALLAVYFLELRTEGTGLIHILCVCLIAGRLIHAYGVSQVNENLRLRVVGMALTFGCLISASTRILASYAT